MSTAIEQNRFQETIMTDDVADRRKHPRNKCEGVVTISVNSGIQRGSKFVSLLHDISDGGMCVILDGGTFERGTAVAVEFLDGIQIPAWVCHCTTTADFCRLGLAFEAVSDHVADTCWEHELCRLSPVKLA